MDIEGDKAILTGYEQHITGYTSPVPVADLDIELQEGFLAAREAHLTELRAADDDDLLHHERASIQPKAILLERDKKVISAMKGKLLEHALGVNLDFVSEKA